MSPLVKFWLTAIYGGVAGAGLIMLLVFWTGQTFGQRCAAIWTSGSPEWQSCVHKFAHE